MAKATRIGDTTSIHFLCPGCNETHTIKDGPGGWVFNGNFDSPTFTPSVLVRQGHYASHSKCTADTCLNCKDEDFTGFGCYICHSFVKEGMIQFLNDCTHGLAGKTVPLLDVGY